MRDAKTARKPIQDEDFALVQAINAGQRERFEELVRKYQQKVFNFGMRMCGEPRDAEDLVQETFLNVFRYLAGFSL